MASSNLRSSSSLLNILQSSLNLLLFLLSAASFAPVLLLRTPPTSFGRGLLAVSLATLLSSLMGFYSHLTHHQACFVAHVAIILLSSAGQALGFFSLFLRPEQSLRLLESAHDTRDVEMLVRIVEGLMATMFVVSSTGLVLECMVQSWWVREYEEVEAAAAATARKSSRRTARVQVVSVAEHEVAREMDERMKHQQSAGTELEV